MRTTLNLDDDVYSTAETLAKASGKTLGKVLSELARAGLRPQSQPQPVPTETDALPAFYVGPEAPLISLKTLRQHWQEE